MNQPTNPAQDVSGALRQAAIVLELWEGEPDETGYMGDFNDAAQILLILADHAARELQQAQPADVWESYKTWPADIRAKLSCHDLRRMSGWAAKSPIADWRIDTSAGGPILVYQNCSVIESEQAQYVLNLIAQDQQAELQQAQVMGEVVAWAVDRDQDPTFPRIFLTEAQADNMVNHVTITPPATKRPVIGYAAMKAALESALAGRGL